MKKPGEGWLARMSSKSQELCSICASHWFTNSLIENLCNTWGFMVKQFFGRKVNLLYISFFVLPHMWPWSAQDVIQLYSAWDMQISLKCFWWFEQHNGNHFAQKTFAVRFVFFWQEPLSQAKSKKHLIKYISIQLKRTLTWNVHLSA